MPNPVPLATKEEEERRAWVTSHHEVVRLIKDCFGDRFSNNEIFDRLKISRRTGYRALGNDERIGKAPGRKPKITEDTIKNMIEYIENGYCSEVGNVWKHLAEQFAPDCNPKTVQDAVKKSGFKNYRSEFLHNQFDTNPLDLEEAQGIGVLPANSSVERHASANCVTSDQVKLEPLLNQEVPENQPAPQDEPHALQQQQQQTQALQTPVQHYAQAASLIDPTFQQNASRDLLRQAISTSPDTHIRTLLWEACQRYTPVEDMISTYLYPFINSVSTPQAATSGMHTFGQHTDDTPLTAKRPRIAICRRCQQQYDRAENSMENRQCLYHKGSPQKTDPTEVGTIEDVPHAFTWSCCGGNGLVRGCCRAMHTTKKKRKYGKKRDATEAGMDEEDAGDGVDSPLEDTTAKLLNAAQRSHIESSQAEEAQLLDKSEAPRYHQQHLDHLDGTAQTHHATLDATQNDLDRQQQQQLLPLHTHITAAPHTHSNTFDPQPPHHLDDSASAMSARLQTLQEDMQSTSLPVQFGNMPFQQIQGYSLAQNHMHTPVNVQTSSDGYQAHVVMDMKHAIQGHHQQAQQQQNAHRLDQGGVGLPAEFAHFAVEQLAQQQ